MEPTSTVRPGRPLLGRDEEQTALDALLSAVAAGSGRALVVRGEPGVGKSALLDDLRARAGDLRTMSAVGVESERQLAFAALHQLCAPLLDRLDRLPGPQREALAAAFGLAGGAAPNRFLVGLAALSLLAEAAEDGPLLLVADDAQWFDEASAQVLAFVARRVGADAIGVVLATRGTDDFAGLPELVVGGLGAAPARALLESAITGPLDAQIADRIVAETRGNPLALLELPRGLTPSELADGLGLPPARPLTGRIEESFQRRLERLPEPTRRLALVAAAEPTGDPVLVHHAAGRLGIDPAASAPLVEAGLATFGTRVCFRHPLVRSAAYWAAPVAERQRAHVALAEATDPRRDPDRRAWHRARASSAPAEDVAAELEAAGARARDRGGLAEAAAFLRQAALLTPAAGARACRALAAAEAMVRAGDFAGAPPLLAVVDAGPPDELRSAQADVLRGQVALALNVGDAPERLLTAARRLRPLDVGLARETCRDAFYAALTAGRLAEGAGVLEVAQVARDLPPSLGAGRGTDLLLDGLARLVVDGPRDAVPILRRALALIRDEPVTPATLPWLPLACRIAHDVWDGDTWDELSARVVEEARAVGALDLLPFGLKLRLAILLRRGEVAAAAACADEAERINEMTGRGVGPYGEMVVAAWRGDEAHAMRLIRAVTDSMRRRGEGQWLTASEWSAAVLHNGQGRFEEACAAARAAAAHTRERGIAQWALPELVEAAARTGRDDEARDALERLARTTRPCGGDWALGLEARCRALTGDGAAERHHQEAIERLSRAGERVEAARARLLYGEWLRRERRRMDARVQLRAAQEAFAAMGLRAFADRAARELLATGERARRRTVDTGDELTAQEAQIAALARAGRSNREIATQLFISPRTVEYHLHKVFAKLGIRSRTQLDRVLADGDAGGRDAAEAAG